jgi:DNA-binding PadR family transcriptional regulator
MLELAILGLLHEQELHGYELKKRLGETLGPFSGASFGSLYPALRRLEAAGAVKAVEANDPAATTTGTRTGAMPMTGSLGGELAAFAARRRSAGKPTPGGRKRKVYGITDRGRELFDELLANDSPATADDDRTFTLRLAFARYLLPAARLRLLERRRAHLVERLAQSRSNSRSRHQQGGLDLYTRSVLEHANESTERDIAWLDALIAAEKGNLK